MASLTLQNVDQACRIQLDTGFLLTLHNTEAPECLLPVMFRVSTAWRRAKETDPTSLDLCKPVFAATTKTSVFSALLTSTRIAVVPSRPVHCNCDGLRFPAPHPWKCRATGSVAAWSCQSDAGDVAGTYYDKQACMVKALELDMRNPRRWKSLAKAGGGAAGPGPAAGLETEASPLQGRPLRCSLLISLILELVARLERLQSDETLQKQAQELHWLTPDLKWQYRVWNPAAGGGTGALEVDTSRTPLAQETVLEHLAQAQKLALEASNLTRFQATRPLAEDMTGSHVAFLLDVGLRGRATPLHKILTTLVDCECLSLIAATAETSPPASGGSSVEVALIGLRLRNPDQQCYVNALAFASLCWLGDSLTVQAAAPHPFFRALRSLSQMHLP